MGCLLFNTFINDLGKLLSNKPELFTVVKSKADFKNNLSLQNECVTKWQRNFDVINHKAAGN